MLIDFNLGLSLDVQMNKTPASFFFINLVDLVGPGDVNDGHKTNESISYLSKTSLPVQVASVKVNARGPQTRATCYENWK